MAVDWANEQVGTLKIKSATDATKTFTLNGVNTASSAGSPDVFLTSANKILAVVNEAAILRGMRRTLSQEVTE